LLRLPELTAQPVENLPVAMVMEKYQPVYWAGRKRATGIRADAPFSRQIIRKKLVYHTEADPVPMIAPLPAPGFTRSLTKSFKIAAPSCLTTVRAWTNFWFFTGAPLLKMDAGTGEAFQACHEMDVPDCYCTLRKLWPRL
jgi:hypothetical protein